MKRVLFVASGLGPFFFATLLAGGCGNADTPEGALLTPDAGYGDEKTSLPEASFGDGSSNDCPSTCSEDFRSVLDCEGRQVETCAEGMDCGAGKCLPPCEAAALNKSSIGCEYYVPAPFGLFSGGCFVAYVANRGKAPVTLTVDRDGTTFDTKTFAYLPSGSGPNLQFAPLSSGELPAGEVAALFLSRDVGGKWHCPSGIDTAVTIDPAVQGSGFGKAFRIRSSGPVVAYDVYPYGAGLDGNGTAGSTLLLPTSVWDTNYMGFTAYDNGYNQWISVVAQDDETVITLNPVVAVAGGGGVPAAPANVPQTYTLNRGELVQIAQSAELSGSPIESNKPVGVFGGADCLILPERGFCDSAHLQMPPVRALGSEYAVVSHRDRSTDGTAESEDYRIMGLVDGTELAYETSRPPLAPLSLSAGEVVEFHSARPFVVRSDEKHPFYLAMYMTGSFNGMGDPEVIGAIPSRQYLSSYVFFTDPTYPETNLVFVRTKGGKGFADVTLDCTGPLTGWQPLGSSGAYEWTRADLSRHNFQPQGTCDNGRHFVSSDNPFGLTIWGWGSVETEADGGASSRDVSYGYSAGMNVRPINTTRVPAK